jgi:L-rhamnose-H+ transport protein
MGALIPLLLLYPARLHSAAGHILLLGIAALLFGVAICAVAGRLRDGARHGVDERRSGSATAGLILAIVCGCWASFQNFGLAFGSPLVDMALLQGASPRSASNAVWLPLLMAGAVPNLLYCGYLLKKNSSACKFAQGGLNHWILAFTMGVFWLGSLLLYGASIPQLGSLGTALAWPLFMSLIVIAASLLGIVTGEWRQSGRWPVTIQLVGVAALIAAIFILGSATQALA